MEEVRFAPNQICVARETFDGVEAGDLSFVKGEKITIVRDSEMMYWYIARNEKGEIGTVPGNYLDPKAMPPNEIPPPIPMKPKALMQSYEKMNPGNGPPPFPPKLQAPMSEEERHMHLLMKRERVKRLDKGTLVVATATFRSNTLGDLQFKLHEELIIIEPTKDLCWYRAHNAYSRSKEGVIPLTHVRPIYMSDEEDEDVYQIPKQPGHERIYEDKNDFLCNSGWFTHGSLPMGKEAHYHCLARKADLSYEKFMSLKKSLYLLQYMNEKTFIGKATVLHEELASHFEFFGKRRKEIREIDDELCHHTYAGGWKLKVWPLEEHHNLELEFAKKVVAYDSLMSADGGINESLTFTNIQDFDNFWSWLSPN